MVFSHIYLLPSPSQAQRHQEMANGRCTAQAWQAREGWEHPGPPLTQARVVLSKKIRHSLITQSEINDRQSRGQRPRPRLPIQWSHESRGVRQKGQEAKASAAQPGSLQAGRGRSQLPCHRGPHPRTRWVPAPLFQGVSPSSPLLPAPGEAQSQLPSGLKSFIAFRSSLPGPR